MVISNFLGRYINLEIPDSKEHLEELSKPFWEALTRESDRAIAIISACLLDNLLEKLIRASYIKDPRVKSLFKNDHILQTFFAKINIAYFSGLIPKFTYDDLKLVCEIRNRFAHEINENLTFSTKNISERIDQLALRPRTLDNVSIPKMKFVLVIQQIVAMLGSWELLISNVKPPNLVELFGLNDMQYEKMALTKEEIIDIIKKGRDGNQPPK